MSQCNTLSTNGATATSGTMLAVNGYLSSATVSNSNISYVSATSGVSGTPWPISHGRTSLAHMFTIMSSAPTPTVIVKLNCNGEVEWPDGIQVNEAVASFTSVLEISAEHKAGISARVKQSMRDSVFNDLINIASEKGALTADDLTHLLAASKIVEKLKGE